MCELTLKDSARGESACLSYHALMQIKCVFPALTLSWVSCILAHSGIRSLLSAPLSGRRRSSRSSRPKPPGTFKTIDWRADCNSKAWLVWLSGKDVHQVKVEEEDEGKPEGPGSWCSCLWEALIEGAACHRIIASNQQRVTKSTLPTR